MPELDVLPPAAGWAVTEEFLMFVVRFRPWTRNVKDEGVNSLMMVIFLPNTVSLMVNVKALVFTPSLKKKSPKSQCSIKIPVLTQKDNFSNISRKRNLQNLRFYLLPRPHPTQLCKCGGGSKREGVGEYDFSCFCLASLTRFHSVQQIILIGTAFVLGTHRWIRPSIHLHVAHRVTAQLGQQTAIIYSKCWQE